MANLGSDGGEAEGAVKPDEGTAHPNSHRTAVDETDRDLPLSYAAAPRRRTRILDLVQASSFRSAAELSEMLGVSEMTIRRDIRRMASAGLVRSVHGGVSAIGGVLGGVDFRRRSTQRVAAKAAIGRAAVKLVAPGSVIGIDAGTTTLQLALHLKSAAPLTVVTPSLPVMATLAGRPEIEIIGLGGVLHHETQSFAGPAATSAAEGLRLDTLFLAASGVSDDAIYCGNLFDAATKRALIAASDQVVMLVDSAKFQMHAMVLVCALTDVHAIVVDDALPQATREDLMGRGIELIVARTHEFEDLIEETMIRVEAES